jgi:tetratricopeptide (TPR) repeat protein
MVNVVNEPTPEFNETVMGVVRQWEVGEMTFKETIAQLTVLSQQAIAEGHIVHQGRVEQLLGYVQHYRGNLETSIHHNKRARKLYEQAGNGRRVGVIDLNQGENYRFKGELSRSIQLYQLAYEAASQHDDLTTQTLSRVNEGLALMTLHRDDEAVDALQAGYQLAQTWPDDTEANALARSRMLCEVHHGMATINLRNGNPQKAWTEAVQALTLAQTGGDPIQLGYAFRIIGEVITELDGAPLDEYDDDPDVYFRQAQDAFRQLNAEAEIARTMFAQALSLGKRGRRTTAARKLQHVIIMFSRLGMADDVGRAAEAQRSML